MLLLCFYILEEESWDLSLSNCILLTLCPAMQSDRFFNALKGHGALSRLVILPHESHGYTARESIMHVLWETDRWLHKHCVSNTSVAEEDHETATVKEDVSKETTNAENKVVATSGGGSREVSELEYEEFHSLPRSSLW